MQASELARPPDFVHGPSVDPVEEPCAWHCPGLRMPLALHPQSLEPGSEAPPPGFTLVVLG